MTRITIPRLPPGGADQPPHSGSKQDWTNWDKIAQKLQYHRAYLVGMIPANRSRRQPEPREANAGKPWDPPDLFFLMASVERGMTIQEVAGFLRRPASEVQEKAIRKADLTATLVKPSFWL